MKTYTPDEAGELIRRSGKTVRRLIAAGELPAVNVAVQGRPALRVTQKALDAWLESREMTIPKRRGRAA